MDRLLIYMKIGVSVALSGLSYIIGGLDMLFSCLITLIIIDYITGVLAAICQKRLSSKTGFIGIIKKVCIIIVIAVANCVATVTGLGGIRELTVSFYIANEGISILENLGEVGVPLPEKLRAVLLQLKTAKEEEYDS